MSSVKPRPRSEGHYYATGSHLIDAANELFLSINQNLEKVDSPAGGLEVDLVAEELRASGLDLRSAEEGEASTQLPREEEQGEPDQSRSEEIEEVDCPGSEEPEREDRAWSDYDTGGITDSPPPSYFSPPPDLERSVLDFGHTSVGPIEGRWEDSVTTSPTNCEPTDMAEQNKKGACALLGLGFIAAIIAVAVNALTSSHHNIKEGSVGIYFKFGALSSEVTYPGVHWQTPFISRVEEVRIRPQTDTLTPMEAITKDGITNTFNDIQVISRIRVDNLVPMVRTFGLEFREALIFDRVKEELRIFCANNTIDEVYNTKFLDIVGAVRENVIESIERLGDGGLEILNLVVAKPNIPADIARNYKQVKVQWTEQLVATQRQKTEQITRETEKLNALADADKQKAVLEVEVQKQLIKKEGEQNLALLEAQHQQKLELVKKETEKQKAIANAERDKAVTEIINQRRILEKEGDQKISEMNNEQLKKEAENKANIKKEAIEKEAEANKALFTEEYIKLGMARAISPNTKYYFSGENGIVSGLIGKIMD